jgi:hypothetical protein
MKYRHSTFAMLSSTPNSTKTTVSITKAEGAAHPNNEVKTTNVGYTFINSGT